MLTFVGKIKLFEANSLLKAFPLKRTKQTTVGAGASRCP